MATRPRGTLTSHPDGTSDPDDRTAGFTLVEMLVALSIVGLLSATVLGFAGQLGRIASLEPRLTDRREAEMAAGFLSQTLSGALPLGIDRQATQIVPFEGEVDAVTLVGQIRTGVRATGLRTIHFELDGGDLLLRAEPRRPLDPSLDINPEIVVADVTELRLRYWGADPNDAERVAWSDNWSGRDDLPRAVAVTLLLDRGGRTVEGSAVAIVHAAE